MLNDIEQKHDWSQNDQSPPLEVREAQLYTACIHVAIEEHAARTPESVAVVYEDQRLTYAELNQRANQLAHHLRALGVGPDVLVGLYLERSLDLIVALVGILKAGGAYVPIDATYPADRVAYMLEESRTQIVVTHQHLRAHLPVNIPYPIAIDADWLSIARQPMTNPTSGVTIANLVYVIFTSGSTGKPKGTMIEHRQLLNYLQGVAKRLALPGNASYASVSTISGDLGNTAVFGALTRGGTLHVVAQQRSQDADALAEYLHQHAIDCLKLTPSHMTALLEAEHPAWALPRKAVVMGGEFAHWPLIARLHQLAPDCRIINHYGPTETTVGVATYDATLQPDVVVAQTVPVGYALGNSLFYILDSAQQPVPAGAKGELYVGGAGLARGYIYRPELTAERFMRDPFRADPDARMYRTGDLARLLPSGAVELLGRQDNQVKIRGFRIELGEIEATLMEMPMVTRAVVLARDEANGDKRLIAYVVAMAGQPVDQNSMRAYLRSKLPDYMIPLVFMVLDALPLTANGKVDHRALPEPAMMPLALVDDFTPPRNALEETLASIWAEALGLGRVGIYDDFFMLGGNSLLAMHVVAHMRRVLQRSIPTRLLFAAPTIALFVERLQQNDGADLPDIERQDRARYRQPDGTVLMPASLMQESLWFLGQLEGTNDAYNLQSAVRIHGPFDVEILKQTLRALLQRHEILRTTLVMQHDQLMQRIAPDMDIPLSRYDISHLDAVECLDEARRIVTLEMERPFDLAQGPLWRATIIRLSAEEHILSFPQHHSIADGAAMHVLLSETATLYHDLAQRRASLLAELPFQYADFAVWQRAILAGPEIARQLEFWREHLAGASTSLNLPTDRPRPPMQSFHGARHLFTLPKDLLDELRALSKQEGATLFMTLLASFGIVLARYGNQEELLIGSPVEGRSQRGTERLLGAFLNSIVLRCDVSGNPTFRELLGRVRQETLQALANEVVPFDTLVQHVHPERIPGQNPLFQAMLSYWEMQPIPHDWQQIFMNLSTHGAKFDLYLELDDQPETCTCLCEYSTDLFDEATIARLMAHWQHLLAAIARDPSSHVAQMPLLDEAERRMLLETWNTTDRMVLDATVSQLFETQVAAMPDAIAVVFEAQTLTYHELNQQANQLAHHLRQRGVTADTLVGLCVERSLAMVVGLLGILKAGGAYLPIDPALPIDRIAYMLEDAQAPLLIIQSQLAEIFSAFDGQLLKLDELAPQLGQQPTTNPTPITTPQDMAYVIYTSGSTGRPKGVPIEHRALTNFLQSMRREPGISSADTLLALTTLSFDIAGLEMFLPLIVGARLVIVRREVAMDGWELAQALERSNVTIMQAAPTVWRLLLTAGWQGRPQLKVLCGGEALAPDLAAQLLHRVAELWNMYGPTETTIWSSLRRITADLPMITIGRPIDNTRIYILDAYQQPVPIGVAGEIYIGGMGLARGYLHRPELTAERFVRDPFHNDANARMYRTGDLGCFLPNGEIKHLGRLDYQVKIRGFRIELGEIEAVLVEHPGVHQAVVVARDNGTQGSSLVAYVVPTSAHPLNFTDVRAFLLTRLPVYMVPDAFMQLDVLPLTPNKKIDRRALPVPEQVVSSSTTSVAPTTPVQQKLVQIWEQLLPVRPIGITDNFFEIGGHSLLAVIMIRRIEDVFGLRLPVAALFQSTTIARLSERLAQTIPALVAPAAPTTLVPIQTAGTRVPFFFLPGDWNGGGFYCLEIAKDLGPDQPFYVLDPQSLPVEHVPLTLEEMATLHVASLRTVQPHGPYRIGGFCIGGLVAYEIARQLRQAGESVEVVLMIDSSVTLPRMRMARRMLESRGTLTRREKIDWFLRLNYANTLIQRAGIRERQLLTGQWKRLLQREQVAFAGEPPVAADMARTWEGIYTWAAAAYLPGHYAGTMTLLWARENLLDAPHDWQKAWQRHASQVEFHVIPGSHLSCVTRHVHALADQIKAVLQQQDALH